MKKLTLLIALLLIGRVCFAQERAIKSTFLSWGTGSSKICYEWASPARPASSEAAIAIICAGADKYNNNPVGLSLRYAKKFFIEGNSEAHPLRGIYLRPEAVWTNYKYDSKKIPGTRKIADMLALLGTAGVQHEFGHFIIDGWFGGGYAFGEPSETGYMHGFQLWKWLGRTNDHIAMSFSIRLGYCF